MNILKLIFLLFIIVKLPIEASNFELGKKAYDEKNYIKAIYYFKKAKKEYLNVEMQLLWADSEKELGRPGYIISAYERIINLEPKNFEISYKLIEVYKELELYEELKKIISNFDDSDYLAYERTLLAQDLKIDNLKISKFTGRILYETGYDSDIDKISYRDNIKKKNPIPINTQTSSIFSKLTASASYMKDLTYEGNLFIKIDIDAVQKLNWIEPFYDLGYLKINSTLGYNTTYAIILLPVHYSNTYYMQNDIITNYGVNPSFSKIIDANKKLNFSLKLEETRHSQNHMNIYDFNTYGASLGLQIFYNENYFSSDISYKKITSTNKYNVDFLPRYVDSHIYALLIDSMFRLNYDYMLKLEYELKIINSSVEYYVADGTLNDNFNSVGFVLSKDVSKKIKIFVKVNYYTNLTIFYDADYDKITSSIGLEYNF